jgi:hypothetical protein
MRRLIAGSLLAAALASVLIGVAASASGESVAGKPAKRTATVQSGLATAQAAAKRQAQVSKDVLTARFATRKYVTDLRAAKAAGYGILTRMIPNMGYHFINPKVTGFNLRRPPILVYEHRPSGWQLGALEWVFTSKPSKPPLPGAQYGVFGAACHYDDGTVVFADAQSKCPPKAPKTGAKFNFWHPRLVTLHFWIWYPNPTGIYTGTNPMVTPFNHG